MPSPFPTAATVSLAIDIYMKLAYNGAPPFAVAERLESLRKQPAEFFYQCDAFEHDLHTPPTPRLLQQPRI